MDSATLTIFGNALIAVAALLGIVYFHRWTRRAYLTDNTRTVAIAWVMREVAVFIRVGWWMVAALLPPAECSPCWMTQCVYNEWMFDNKHLMTVPVSLLYVYAQVLFVQHIEKISLLHKFLLIAAAIAIAAGITIAGY